MSAEILAELRRINARLDSILAPVAPDAVLTREEAAKQLKVSVRQLRRLVAAGHIAALPSGIARAEIQRYATTPAERLRYRPNGKRKADAKEMAQEVRAFLRTRGPRP